MLIILVTTERDDELDNEEDLVEIKKREFVETVLKTFRVKVLKLELFKYLNLGAVYKRCHTEIKLITLLR